MQMHTRREFLKHASATIACGAAFGAGGASYAQMPALPLGIQLYSVREQLVKDYAGTLNTVGSLGYREVEAAGFYQHSAADVKQAMQKANLRCVSAHYGLVDLHNKLDEILAFSKVVGVQNIVCSSPGIKDPANAGGVVGAGRGHVFTMDDWRFNAEQFNLIGAKVVAAGLRFGYHNHVAEFAKLEGAVPWVELLAKTDPAKVMFELDCGWAIVAGASPVEYLRQYGDRITLLHVKDFKLPAGAAVEASAGAEKKEPKVTELGLGSVDYRPILIQAAKSAKIKHIFVEQEGFDMPWEQSLKVDADYMLSMK